MSFAQEVTPADNNRALSFRRNFAWNVVGIIVYNSVLWLLIAALARLGSVEMVGEYALALAVAAPVFLLIGLNLRVVRATDVRGRWSPSTYRRLRVMLNVAAMAVSVGIAFAIGLRGEQLAVVGAVGLSKAAEATSLLLYGFFQRCERLDLVARSMLLRAALGGAGFVASIFATERLLFACLALAVGWSLTYWVHDRTWERRLLVGSQPHIGGSAISLARKAFPLGVGAGVTSVAINVPRFAVQAFLGTVQLGLFVGLAYLSQIVSMIAGAMSDTIVGPLAKSVESGNRSLFVRLLGRLLAFGLAVSLIGALGAAVIGDEVIGVVLGPQFVNQPVLIVLMLGAGANTVQRCLARGLHAAHRFEWVMGVDILILSLTIVAALVLVPRYGMIGAAASLGLGFLGGMCVTVVLLARVLRQMRGRAR